MILVVSYPGDDHSDDVIARLQDAGRAVGQVNLADFPTSGRIVLSWQKETSPHYRVGCVDREIDLAEVGAVWWRRVVPFEIDPRVREPSQRAFAESETSIAVHGGLDTLDCEWVNPRGADESAHRKPFQWDVACRVGMPIPRTLVTNVPAEARSFIRQVGADKTVFKAFLATTEAWRETRLVEPGDLARLDAVQFAPVIFQEYVEGVDLRVTVVGDEVFAAEIDARRTSYPVDMRMVIGEAPMCVVELPADANEMILALMRGLGLVFGAIDMRRTAEGQLVFLEVNPAGQWLFVERRTGLQISQAVADLLCSLDDQSRRTSDA